MAFSKEKPNPVSFDLDGQTVSQIMRVIYIEAYRERPYFLDPVVLQDQRTISFRYLPHSRVLSSGAGVL
jgi:hypothetical protein